MLFKMVVKDFKRKKIITSALFIFIALPAFLIAGGAGMIIALSGSVNYFLSKAEVPHFVQMHSGSIDRDEIEMWSSQNKLVSRHQIVEMVTIDGSDVFLSGSGESEAESVMDLGFVKQNRTFDLLLDPDNNPVTVSRGNIAVPVYHKLKRNMKTGDTVRIAHKSFIKEYKVSGFIRDAQMNPSIIHSKRFVVHEDDFENLKKSIGEAEYLIEFQLSDISRIGDFSSAYEASGLPGSGPSIDYNLFRVINVLTDSISAVIVIFVSLLFSLITILCLRFTILASIEEDYREIGVMKAIGIRQKKIKNIYLAKYAVIGLSGTTAGYLLYLISGNIFNNNIMLYLGSAPAAAQDFIIPLSASVLIFAVIMLSCIITLGRFHRISAVEALRAANTGDAYKNRNFLSLGRSKICNTNILLGVRDVISRFKLYWLLCFVFIVCTFVIVVPVNFLSTIKSPAFVTYLGIGQSDIRIDLRQSENMAERFAEMLDYIEKDNDIEKAAPMITSRFLVKDSDGVLKSINVETGDFTIFPLNYISGSSPVKQGEIALSFLSAKEMDKKSGDTLILYSKDQKMSMKVSGIYQDVTSGGHTAKAALTPNWDTVLWYVVNLNVKTEIAGKADEYSKAFYPARVTNSKLYLEQTMGETIRRLEFITFLSIITALIVSVLITSLFLKMIIAKDASQIAIMKSIGFALRDLRIQYTVRALSVLGGGIIAGTIAANTIGQSLVSAIWSFMGASRITFIINPVHAYLVFPLILMITVSAAALISISEIKYFNIADLNAE